jgi:hypothetical protein
MPLSNHADSGSPPLRRPTVADAEDYPYYRPRADPDAPWGLTEPLPVNPDALPPQPEVVMSETNSKGLLLPFRVVQEGVMVAIPAVELFFRRH